MFINNSLNLCYYPNRDSTKYGKLYNIPEVETLIRGTIRFKGYVEIVSALMELELLDINTSMNNNIKSIDFIT